MIKLKPLYELLYEKVDDDVDFDELLKHFRSLDEVARQAAAMRTSSDHQAEYKYQRIVKYLCANYEEEEAFFGFFDTFETNSQAEQNIKRESYSQIGEALGHAFAAVGEEDYLLEIFNNRDLAPNPAKFWSSMLSKNLSYLSFQNMLECTNHVYLCLPENERSAFSYEFINLYDVPNDFLSNDKYIEALLNEIKMSLDISGDREISYAFLSHFLYMSSQDFEFNAENLSESSKILAQLDQISEAISMSNMVDSMVKVYTDENDERLLSVMNLLIAWNRSGIAKSIWKHKDFLINVQEEAREYPAFNALKNLPHLDSFIKKMSMEDTLKEENPENFSPLRPKKVNKI